MKALFPWIRVIARRKGRLVIGALLMLSTVLAAVALLGLSGWFITATGLTALVMAVGISTYFDVYVPGAGIRAFALTRTISRYLERLYNHDTILRLLADLRLHLFGRLSQINPNRLSRQRSGQWLNRLTQDVDALDNLYLRLLAPPIVALISSLVVAGVVAIWLPKAAVLLLIGLSGLLILSTWVPARSGTRFGRQVGEKTEQLRWHGIDHLQGMAELKAAHKETAHAQRLWQAHETLQSNQEKLARLTALINSLTSALLSLLVVILLVLGIQGYIEAALSGPVLVMLLLATLALTEAFASLPKAFSQFGHTLLAAERLNDLQEELPPQQATGLEQPDTPILVCRNLSASRGGERLFDGLSFHLELGDWLVITGPSGRGKSSLASLIAGMNTVDEGDVLIRGKPPGPWPQVDGPECIAWLTQETQIFSDTVANNLLLAKPEATDRQLWEVLEWVELADRVEQGERGLDTWVGEGGLPLSGGEQRRLALARILLQDAPLVLLDEPFRGLDAATAERLMLRLQHWGKDCTLVWFAHEQSVLPVGIPRIQL